VRTAINPLCTLCRRAEALGYARRSPPARAVADYFFKDHRPIIAAFVVIDTLMERLGHRSDVWAQVPDSEMVTIAVVAAKEEKGEKSGTRLRDERLSSSSLLFFSTHHERAMQIMHGRRFRTGRISGSRFNVAGMVGTDCISSCRIGSIQTPGVLARSTRHATGSALPQYSTLTANAALRSRAKFASIFHNSIEFGAPDQIYSQKTSSFWTSDNLPITLGFKLNLYVIHRRRTRSPANDGRCQTRTKSMTL